VKPISEGTRCFTKELQVFSTAEQFLDKLPPLKRKTNANLACLIGLLAGGIGLALYFRTFVDLVIPVAISLVIVLAFADVGMIGGAIIAALYGYARSHTSNERLAPAVTA
jgi:hypothetical protein